MAKVTTPGLGKSKGDVGGDWHLDDGDYLVEGVSCEFQWKPKDGRQPDDENCPYQYAFRMTILGAPDQGDGKNVQGRMWTSFSYIDPDHEYTTLMVDKLKNVLNSFGLPVRQDGFKEETFGSENKAVMRVKNAIDKRTGDLRSNIKQFLSVEDTEYAGLE